MGAPQPDDERFDPRQRAAEKDAARERDRLDLENGHVAPPKLRGRNGAIARALNCARGSI